MPESKSVAIVDDEKGVVRTYELLFKRRGIPVAFVAYDGPEAVEKLKSANPKPAVVIIDFRLPSMSGIDVMREMLALAPETRVIFISADDSIRNEAIGAGADVFIKKPASLKVMTETIYSLMTP
jgi:two-component system, chemotaxis family, chemotaxis protein CheY